MLRSAWVLGVGDASHDLVSGKGLPPFHIRYARGLVQVLRSGCPGVSRAILSLAGLKSRSRGAEHLDMDGASIVIANHESWFDVWALAGWLPFDIRFVGKELMWIPIFGRACGFAAISRSIGRTVTPPSRRWRERAGR